jgi:hypothetical protein
VEPCWPTTNSRVLALNYIDWRQEPRTVAILGLLLLPYAKPLR